MRPKRAWVEETLYPRMFDSLDAVFPSLRFVRDAKGNWQSALKMDGTAPRERRKEKLVVTAKCPQCALEQGEAKGRNLISLYQDIHGLHGEGGRDRAIEEIAAALGLALPDGRGGLPDPEAEALAELRALARMQEQERPREYISEADIEAAASQAPRSPLYAWLCSRFPEADVARVMADYRAGASPALAQWHGGAWAALFPLISAEGRAVDAHIMAYGADGRRSKAPEMWKCQDWLLRRQGRGERRAPWPLFGEHLAASRPGAPVGIVESEKTAIVAALAAPAYVWCATLSLANLTAARLSAVKGREIYLFPDRDGAEAWRSKAEALRREGHRLYFCGPYIEAWAKGPKDDLADIILDSIKA